MAKVPLSQSQVNALADYIFNRGNRRFTEKILPDLNAGHYDKIPDLIASDVGDNLPGNVRRRRAEADLFADKLIEPR
jgi:GH24 family phage-related lysozyme (muramidase)